jgi:hypothetical protein
MGLGQFPELESCQWVSLNTVSNSENLRHLLHEQMTEEGLFPTQPLWQ